MFKIINKRIIADNIKRIEIEADLIARKIQPGQFVMAMADENSLKIPLPVVDQDAQKGLISLVVEENDASARRLGDMPIGSSFFSLLGPLGMPAKIGKAGVVLCIGHGMGSAYLLPICRALKKSENKVIGIIGAEKKRALILENQMRLSCHKVYITTEDGSYERRGSVVDALREVLAAQSADAVYAAGPVRILHQLTEVTHLRKLKTFVHLKLPMFDGIGLCGSCRLKVSGQERLACIDGPMFDSREVDFQDLMMRVER